MTTMESLKDLGKLTVKKLKERLVEHELDTSGLKKDLIQRLHDFYEQQQQPNQSTPTRKTNEETKTKTELTEADIDKMTVDKLKKTLKKFNSPVKGNKKSLQQALKDIVGSKEEENALGDDKTQAEVKSKKDEVLPPQAQDDDLDQMSVLQLKEAIKKYESPSKGTKKQLQETLRKLRNKGSKESTEVAKATEPEEKEDEEPSSSKKDKEEMDKCIAGELKEEESELAENTGEGMEESSEDEHSSKEHEHESAKTPSDVQMIDANQKDRESPVVSKKRPLPSSNSNEATDPQEPKRKAAKSDVEPTCTLRIDNFVRPFTQVAVKELLQQHGKFVEGGFWMNSIKSHCYVTYETKDVATATRDALFNLQWPAVGGKNLSPKFASRTAMEVAKDDESSRSSTSRRQQVSQQDDARRSKPPVTIDELFMKTTTKPMLYYLPLSEAQVKEKQRRTQNGLSRR